MLNINYKNDVREKQRREIIAMLRCLRDVRAISTRHAILVKSRRPQYMR